jgi:hypothetical protein
MPTLNRFRTISALGAILPVLLVASAGCDIAMAEHKQKETSEWRKTYDLQPGGRVEIGNVNGKIQVVPGEGNKVEVVATKTGHGMTSEAAKEALNGIEILEDVSSTVVKIQTRIARRSGSGLFGGSGLQVEYMVRVPVSAEVKATTVNGGVEVTGVSGKVSAEATNGGVKLRDLTGGVEASTTNGGVDVDLARLSEAGVKLECTNGGIKLRLPADSKASISARQTNGGIETSGLNLDSNENSRRRLDARLNGGGARIEIEGTNGGIRISSR